jgi:hypothetical protein
VLVSGHATVFLTKGALTPLPPSLAPPGGGQAFANVPLRCLAGRGAQRYLRWRAWWRCAGESRPLPGNWGERRVLSTGRTGGRSRGEGRVWGEMLDVAIESDGLVVNGRRYVGKLGRRTGSVMSLPSRPDLFSVGRWNSLTGGWPITSLMSKRSSLTSYSLHSRQRRQDSVFAKLMYARPRIACVPAARQTPNDSCHGPMQNRISGSFHRRWRSSAGTDGAGGSRF